jgi:ABC-type transport system involved in cytochrome c biogenesis permease component
LILSDVECASCGQVIGVQWAFRAVFFAIILIATLFTILVVLADQGLYAALLMMTLPIGAIGFIKARYSPLVVRKRKAGAESASS